LVLVVCISFFKFSADWAEVLMCCYWQLGGAAFLCLWVSSRGMLWKICSLNGEDKYFLAKLWKLDWVL